MGRDARERPSVRIGRRIRRRVLAAALAAAASLVAAPHLARAAVPHVVQPGETLSGIAATDGLPLETLAAYNGLSTTAYLIAGQTITIPAVGETSTVSTSLSSSGLTHVVQPGETLWGIAAANGISEPSLAAYNGLATDAYLISGQTISIPALSATGSATSSSTSTSTSSGPPVPGLSPIYCPCGTVYLRSDAAAAWESMRQASIADFGIDLYPDGPISAYRTWTQQNFLYNSFLDGTGAPADPPGTSSHELGTAVDVATPQMRWAIDQIGAQYGWGKSHGPGEWWHVDYLG
jgi:LysM repeat protein